MIYLATLSVTLTLYMLDITRMNRSIMRAGMTLTGEIEAIGGEYNNAHFPCNCIIVLCYYVVL
jgi:hypothetical protein